jgi:anti-anti-sigma factor
MSVHERGHQEEHDVPTSIPAPGPEAPAASGEASVRTHRLGDGLVVRLSGVLDGQAVPALRQELLGPLPTRCTDVLVDAAHVVDLTDDALAVLLAGSSWAGASGARFALSAVSPAVAAVIEELDLGATLPTLDAAG